MMTTSRTVAVVVSMVMVGSGMVVPSVSAWSLSPWTSRTLGQSWNYRNSETVLQAVPDAPLFSDDLTGRTNHGPNPRHLTVKYKETMLRQAYDEWRAKYGRGDFDNERFRIFKFNFLASLRAYEFQTARAKIEGLPLPKLLELNAYGDCTKEEYLQLKQQESQNLVAPRTVLDANATSTANVTANANVTTNVNVTVKAPTATTPPVTTDALPKTPEPTAKKPYSLPVDNRGPERERIATSFPQRSTNLTTALTPLSPMTPKVPPTKPLQEQLDDLSRATSSLAPRPNSSSSNKLPQFSSVGTTSQLPKLSQSFLQPDVKGIFPERSASYFPKRTIPFTLAPSKSDQETKLVTKNVNPNPGTSYIPPDQRGIFGDKSATSFPKRTEAHATPKQAPKKEIASTSANKKETPIAINVTKAETSNESSNLAPPSPVKEESADPTLTLPPSTTPPPEVLSDQDKRDVTNVQPDATKAKSATVNSPKSTEETKKTTPTTPSSASTPVILPDTKDVPKIRADPSNVRRSFTQNLASSFSKQGQVNQKTGTGNSNETPPRPSSSVKPDVFYKEQSALSFPKRTEAHLARKVVSDATSSDSLSTTEPVVSPKLATDGTNATGEIGARPSTTPSGSFIKPDIFFQERSAMTFPKRTEAHKSRLPNTESEKKSSPSLSYVKPDFRYPERSVTSFPQRTEEPFALVKAVMFRDDTIPTPPPKTLLPDQSRANIADPFSFAKKKREDLPPPDFKGPKETTTIKHENATAAAAETPLPVTNTVESPPVEPNPIASEAAGSRTQSEKPEVQVSVPDMTDIQLKLAKRQTKESSVAQPKVTTQPVAKAVTPPAETSQQAKQKKSATELASPPSEETKVQLVDDGLKEAEQKPAPKDDTKEEFKTMSRGTAKESPAEPKKDDLLHRALLKERKNMEQKSSESPKSSIGIVAPPEPESKVDATNNTKGEPSSDIKGVGTNDSTTTTTVSKDDSSVAPAATGNVAPQAEQSQAVEKSISNNSKSVKLGSVPEVDRVARQKEIEEALKADFSASGNSSSEIEQRRAVEKSTLSGMIPEIDRIARQREIEEALKADFSAAASTTDRQRQIEEIFEGKVQVQAQRPAAPVYDPFDVRSISGSRSSKPQAPPASVEDVLAAEMNAAKAFKTNHGEDPAIKAAEEVLKAPRTVSIQDVLKAEMDAAKTMKQTASTNEADTVLSVPLSNGSVKKTTNDASAGKKNDLNIQSKGETEHEIENETENATGEEKPQNKKRKRKKKNKNKSAAINGEVNGLSNTQINGTEKEP